MLLAAVAVLSGSLKDHCRTPFSLLRRLGARCDDVGLVYLTFAGAMVPGIPQHEWL